MALSSNRYDAVVNREELFKGFANVISNYKYPKEAKIRVIKGLSNMSSRKNNKDIIMILLKLSDGKFLDGFTELLMEYNVSKQ